MPQLHRHLTEEACLDGSWMNWWLKYDGTKLWSRYDRGRLWDLILGWRPNCNGFELELKSLNRLDDHTLSLLGKDPFWNPTEVSEFEQDGRKCSVCSEVFDEDDDEEEILHNKKSERSQSVLTILSRTHSITQSLERTPTLTASTMTSPPLLASLGSSTQLQIRSPESAVLTPTATITSGTEDLAQPSPVTNDGTPQLYPLEEIVPLKNLPFSNVHPHVEMIFSSLAFLKSKEYAIMELDKSEIFSMLERWSSLTRSDIATNTNTDDESYNVNASSSLSPSPGSSSGSQSGEDTKIHSIDTDGHLNSMSQDLELTPNNTGMESAIGEVRKSVRDIENVLVEAGELWRKFLYIDMTEDSC